MAISVTHTTVAGGTDSGDGKLSKNAWNEAHTITLATAKILGRSSANTGAAEEIGITTGLSLTGGNLLIDKASNANIRAAASNKVVTADLIETASAFQTLTDGASIALDWDAGINFQVTLGGNRTLSNPTNGQPGTMRLVRVIQDGTGSRTLSYGANYKFPGGTAPTLTTTANAIDVLFIICITTSLFYVTNSLNFS